MAGIWNIIERALREASEKDALLAHITLRYGEHEADEIAPILDKMWNPEGLKALSAQLTGAFADPKIEDLLRRAMAKAGVSADGPSPASKTAVAKRDKSGGSQDIATSEPVMGKRGPGRPPGPSKKQVHVPDTQYMDPDELAAKNAKVDATAGMRPDRMGFAPAKHTRQQVKAVPGERPVHDVGTAGQSPGSMPGHTRPVQKQTSQEINPSTLPQELAPLRAQEKELSHRIKGLQIDPKKNAGEINKLVPQLGDVQQKIARLSNAGKSGLEDLQKRVDYVTQTYGVEQGDAMAKKLGVPTTKMRSRKVRDPKGGPDKIVQQIWSAEKIAKMMNQEPELPVGTYDGVPVSGAKRDKEGPWQKGGKLPEPDGGNDASPERAPIRKPMMKNPSTGQMEVRPGKFAGQRFKPSGVSQKEPTTRADQATGNFQYGSRFTNPAEAGQEVIWDGSDWVLPSQWAAKKGQMSAAGVKPSGERRPWQSGAQNVQGNPVSNKAFDQKVGDLAKAKFGGEDQKSDAPQHRDVKKAVNKFFK